MGAELFQTDSHDEAKSRFSQFWERASKRNVLCVKDDIKKYIRDWYTTGYVLSQCLFLLC